MNKILTLKKYASKYWSRGLLTAYIVFVEISAVGVVGTVPEVSTEPYSWTFPLHVLLVFGLAALLGWDACKEHMGLGNNHEGE